MVGRLVIVDSLRETTVALSHHLRLQLHLELFAALPKAFNCVSETSRALCIPVHMSVLVRCKENYHIPHGAFNEFSHHLLYSWILLITLKQGLLRQRGGDICPCILV